EVERWSQIFHTGIYPERTARRAATQAVGCPEFGEDTALPRPFDASSVDPIQPGWHSTLAGGAGAVWWDPNHLELGRQERGGIRQQEILSADGDASDAVRRHHAWRERLDAQRSTGSLPVCSSQSVTQVAHGLVEPELSASPDISTREISSAAHEPHAASSSEGRRGMEWLDPLLAKVRIEAPL